MAQIYEKVVTEDLNVGTAQVWTAAPAGGKLRSTQVGLHSVARGQREYTAAWTPGAITTGSKASTTVTVPDAAVADFVVASHDKMLTNDLRISAHVSAADTVKVVIQNPTSSTITVAAGTVSVLVFPVIAQEVFGSVSGTIYVGFASPGFEVEGATVEITAQGLSTVTPAGGAYSFSSVSAGSVRVDASCTGLVDNYATGTVVAGANTVIDVVLQNIP